MLRSYGFVFAHITNLFLRFVIFGWLIKEQPPRILPVLFWLTMFSIWDVTWVDVTRYTSQNSHATDWTILEIERIIQS